MVDADDRRAPLEPLDREAFQWVARFASGAARPADLAALKEWAARSPAHAEAFDRANLLWTAAGPAVQELVAEGVELSAARQRSIGGLGRLDRRRLVLGGALAASAAGAATLLSRPPLGLWPSLSELEADYRTEPGAQRRIALADHIALELNTRTSVALRSTGDRADRIELIAGELAVATPAGATKSFIVSAGNGQTTGLPGARFNVLYENHIACVSCLNGSIKVEQGSAIAQLSAGQQTRYSDKGISPAVVVDPAAVTAWQNGVVIFQSTPVSDVVAEVNRYRPGRVILTNAALARRLFNARLRIENIDRVIGQIAEIFGAHATILPGGIVLLG
ncbi:MAG: FecR domain-containing protein [Pseudomonadota bacterium]